MKRAFGAGVLALGCLASVVGFGGFGGSPAVAAKRGPQVLIQTVPPGKSNTFFEVDMLWHPQMAQSLVVTKSQRWTALRMTTYQLKVANSRDVFQWILDGGYDENWFTSYRIGHPVTADVTVEVWRQDGSEPLADKIDLASGFTRVYQSVTKRTITIGVPVTFPLPKGAAVTPGRYLVVLGFRFDDPLVFNLRFNGQENGSNTLGGYNHDQPINPQCAAYTKTKDTYPEGRAYRPIPAEPPDPSTFIKPFVTTFEVAETKVAMPCDTSGVYGADHQIWNPGDWELTVLGR